MNIYVDNYACFVYPLQTRTFQNKINLKIRKQENQQKCCGPKGGAALNHILYHICSELPVEPLPLKEAIINKQYTLKALCLMVE